MDLKAIDKTYNEIKKNQPSMETTTVEDGTYNVIVNFAKIEKSAHAKKPRLLLSLQCDDKDNSNVLVAINPASHEYEFSKFADLFAASTLEGKIEGDKGSMTELLPWNDSKFTFAMGNLSDLIGCTFQARLERKKAGVNKQTGEAYGDKDGFQQEIAKSTESKPSFF